MKKSRYTDEQIAFALRQTETGTPVKEVLRKMGISERPFTAGNGSTVVWVRAKCAT
jgi:putative transposase